jgi:hypothetical protein
MAFAQPAFAEDAEDDTAIGEQHFANTQACWFP